MSRLLIVDDNQQNLYMLQVLLSSNGFKTELASNGAEALAYARRAPPDMIISDILMPVMDGYALCRAWKEDERLKDIPFIFYTATYTDPKDEDFALSLGADRFIVKPLQPDAFLALILETRKNFKAGRPVAAPRPVDETDYYKEYSATLIRKLEDKMLQIEEANRILENDITQRKRAEEELRESENRFRTLVERAPEAIFVQSGGRFVYLNPAMVSLLGASEPQELLDKEFLAHVGPEYHESVRDRIAFQRQTGKPVPLMEQEYLRIDGSRVPVETTAEPIRFQGGDAHLVFVRDITERKRAEEILREREEIYSAIVDQAAEGIVLVDSETLRLVEFNDAACQGLGYSREEFADLTLFDLQGILARKEVTEHARALVKAGHAHFEYQQRRKDGTFRDVLISNRVINLRGREYLVEIWQDITERKHSEAEQARAEAQLKQAQKMEALGTLAGGIAHDFNNILGIIFGYSEMAQADAEDPIRVREYLDQVLNGARRAKDLVQQILAFSRRSGQEKKPLKVGLIVNEALKMLRASLPSTIEIEMNVASKAAVMADPTQIHQVLMNLCTNSAHAMRGDVGVLNVSLTDVYLGPESVPPHSELQHGPHVKLTVKDTGHGIDPSNLDRIFDPFFTTKEQGVGTGLGLSVVHGIVKGHGGAIVVESRPGEGTAFHVFFPAIEAAAEQPAMVDAPLPRGRERILVVDDEPVLAKTAKQMLERLGYCVEFRTSGVDALEAIRHQPKEDPFDLVITDMTMPCLTGADLTRELYKVRSNLAVIICTGFSEKMDREKAKSLGIQGFLMKPVVLKELAVMVRSVLDERKK
ncbi:MAG: response regulator [Syntrophobacteraceae bacterium]